MEFKKFNSIENSYQTEFIKAIYEQGFGEGDFVVQEKVHGAHLSFITNGQDVICAKRTGLIDEEENFYNVAAVLARYKRMIINLYQELSNEREFKTVTIFGEIFGGGYPHKEVAVKSDAKLVQRGIYYSQENDFYAFDILIDNQDYLDVKTANKLFEKFEFVHAKSLFEGGLQECLEFSNEFKTTIPQTYNLPQLEGNTCEGVVIRPSSPLFFNSGSRIMIKNKNEKWSENNQFIDKAILNKILHEELSAEAKMLCEKAYTYISQNRLSNVISKIGEVDPKKDFGRVLGMFNKDILTDFQKENKEAYDALEKQESKAIAKFVNKHASKIVREYFV